MAVTNGRSLSWRGDWLSLGASGLGGSAEVELCRKDGGV